MKFGQDQIDQGRNRRAPGFNNEMCRLPIQGISCVEQFAQSGQRFADLEEGPSGIMRNSTHKRLWQSAQIDDDGAIA